MKTMGQIGYEAYAASTGGKTYDGRDMPTWEHIQQNTPGVADAWECAAKAVRHSTGAAMNDPAARFPFSVALEHLKNGKRVARDGWNGKGMWVALTPGSRIPCEMARAGAAELAAKQFGDGMQARGRSLIIGAHIDMKAADGSLVIGWLASQTDMLANDWCVLD